MSESMCGREQSFRQSETMIEREGASEKEEKREKNKEGERERKREGGRESERERNEKLCIDQNQKETGCVCMSTQPIHGTADL